MANIDYKNRSENELKTMLEELKAKLLQLSFDLENKKLKDVSQIKKTKTEIARILTAINSK